MFLLLLACTGTTEDSGCEAETWHLDADGDGFGDPDRTLESCDQPIGYVVDASDCDDLDAAVNPGATEICDGKDTDCDGLEDFEDDSLDDSELPTWHVDADGDGYGDSQDPGIEACLGPEGSVPNDEDCEDGDAAISPADNEICDGIDNDCDGLVDDEDEVLAASTTDFFEDVDGDGFGQGEAWALCEQPSGWVTADGDCDDADEARFPGAPEICHDGVVQDCEGDADSALAECWWASETEVDEATLLLENSDTWGFWRSVHWGDLDGDGNGDLVMGHGWDSEEEGRGRIYVHTGPLTEDGEIFGDFQLSGDDGMGTSIALGDVDGDGQDDLLVGEPGWDEPNSNSGRAWLVLGPVTGAAATEDLAALEIGGLDNNDNFGTGTAILEDLNGDGGADLAIGALFDDMGADYAGSVTLLSGTLREGVEASEDGFAVVYAEERYAYLGNDDTIVSADFDGDGVAELVLGAYRSSPYGEGEEGDEEERGSEGSVHVFQGPVSGAISTSDSDATLLGHETPSGYTGTFVATGFDWDGDGLEDLATGAPRVDEVDGEYDLGGAFYLMTRTPSGDEDLTGAHLVVRGSAEDQLGGDASIADLDGDGELDLLIGSGFAYVTANSASYSSGMGAWLFYGPLSGELTTKDADTWFSSREEHHGAEVMLLPDQDGDGSGEVGIAAMEGWGGGFYLFDQPEY